MTEQEMMNDQTKLEHPTPWSCKDKHPGKNVGNDVLRWEIFDCNGGYITSFLYEDEANDLCDAVNGWATRDRLLCDARDILSRLRTAIINDTRNTSTWDRCGDLEQWILDITRVLKEPGLAKDKRFFESLEALDLANPERTTNRKGK